MHNNGYEQTSRVNYERTTTRCHTKCCVMAHSRKGWKLGPDWV